MLANRTRATTTDWDAAWERALDAGAGFFAESALRTARAAGLVGREAALHAAAEVALKLRDVLDPSDYHVLTER